MAYVGMVQQIFAEVFHRAEPDAQHVRAVRGVHGHGRASELAHRGALGHAPHFAYGAAGVHRRHGAARRHRRAGAGADLDLRGAAVGDHGVLQPVGIRTSAPWRWSRWDRSRESARPCRDSSRRSAARWWAPLIGRQFNGSTVPLAAGALCCGLASLVFVLLAEKGRLFRRHHTRVPLWRPCTRSLADSDRLLVPSVPR